MIIVTSFIAALLLWALSLQQSKKQDVALAS